MTITQQALIFAIGIWYLVYGFVHENFFGYDRVFGSNIGGHICGSSSAALTTGRQLEDMWFLHTDVHARCFESLHRHRGALYLQRHRSGSCFRDRASGCDCLR